MPRPTVISLYTGAGGLDLGLEAAGFDTRVAVEVNRDAVATLRENRPWPVIDDDIHSDACTSPKILARAKLAVGDADLLVGGPPCQPFSKSGYWAQGDARRLADPRATTLEAYLRVLRDTQPRAFLLENVPGIAFGTKNEGLLLLEQTIRSINAEVGTRYSFHVGLLRAVEFGVPQDRERVFIVGERDGAGFTFPAPTHLAPAEPVDAQTDLLPPPATASGKLPFLTAWDAIGDLEEDDDPELQVGGKWADLLPTIPEGKNYLHHTDRGEGLPLFGWRRRYWTFLLKLSKRLPSWTLTADPGSAIGPFHWKSRRLSALEMMRLQTFPAGYRITGTHRSAQRQLGNAVPSALAERLGLEIRRQFFGEQDAPAELTLLPERRSSIPAPQPVTAVPAKYHALIGEHKPHPGTGQGPGALARVAALAYS
jgi:DNA (cytosine-5)-methyltransferase 1